MAEFLDKGSRVGHGYDVHRLVAGRKLILGGVEIEHNKGLDGHSDADVVLHAISDALLGAAALGDVGLHFPPDDPQFKDADSADLLARVIELVQARGFNRIVNVDATVIAERPRLRPYVDQMRERIANILGIEFDRVNVKATTTERLGFTGREEGIAAAAVVLIATDE